MKKAYEMALRRGSGGARGGIEKRNGWPVIIKAARRKAARSRRK